MLDFNRYDWLSFDCYGTLVDWETGISEAVARVFAAHGVRKTSSEILTLFADAEPKVQMSPEFLEYRRVLHDVMEIMAWGAGVRLRPGEAGSLADSLPRWPVFLDAAEALRGLKERYKLAVVSNVDDDLFAGSAEVLGVDFDAVITSQQAGRYKPDLRNFEIARERMGVESGKWLHVGESLFHDIGPANRLDIDSVWVRRPDRGGGTRATDAVPSLEVPDLSALYLLAAGEQ